MLDRTLGKEPFRSSIQAAICLYLSNHSR